jgi:phosphoribosylformylglycinamidine cyclo-ligase
MPGMYAGEDYDLAGFCVGIAEKEDVIDGTKVTNGDHILSSLLTTNTMPTPQLNTRYISVSSILPLSCKNWKISGICHELLSNFAAIYVKSVLSLLKKHSVHAISHITGGGLLENIPRVLPENLAAKLDNNSWQMPCVCSITLVEIPAFFARCRPKASALLLMTD